MAGLLDRGQAALIRRQKQAAGRTVTYTRLGQTPIAITAWVGDVVTLREQEDPGAAVSWAERDYLFAAADLLLPALTAPRIGDQITETIAGLPVVFEVMPPSGGEPHWRYSDQMRTVIRLHVKRVA